MEIHFENNNLKKDTNPDFIIGPRQQQNKMKYFAMTLIYLCFYDGSDVEFVTFLLFVSLTLNLKA